MTRLSLKEKEDYITNLLLPTFKPLQKQDVYLSVFSTLGELLFVTDKSAYSSSTLSIEQNIGISYNNPPDEQITILQQKYNLDKENILHACKAIYQIQMDAINHQTTKSYIDLIPYNGRFKGYLCIISPLFHPNGEVIALLINSTDYHLFGLYEFLDLHKTPHISSLHAPSLQELSIKLSPRQHEIIFLISHGFSQSEIAQMLSISRGSVSKIISSQICPKLNLNNDSLALIKYAKKSGIQQMIPQSLWKRYIINLA